MKFTNFGMFYKLIFIYFFFTYKDNTNLKLHEIQTSISFITFRLILYFLLINL